MLTTLRRQVVSVMKRKVAPWRALGLLATGVLLGCQTTVITIGVPASGAVAHGSVHGGQHSIGGAEISLYAIGGDGGLASTSLLTAPVRTDDSGDFSLAGLYRCPSDDVLVYIVARGGNPDGVPGTTNSAIALMAVPGRCGDLSSLPSLTINEVTTVGSIWPLAVMMSTPFKLAGTAQASEISSGMSKTRQLVDVANGVSPGTDVPNGFTVPSAKVNTLASILAGCVNSMGGVAGDGSACGVLFALATVAGGVPPTDTLTAALNIAKNPTSSVSALFALSPPAAVFQPTLMRQPADWRLDLLPQLAAPSILPAPGLYQPGQQITITSAAPGTTIRYTIDGSMPGPASPVYSSAFDLATSETVQAIAYSDAGESAPASAAYSVPAPQLALRVTLPDPAIVQGSVQQGIVTLSAPAGFPVTVALKSSSPDVIGISPAVLTLAAGQSKLTFSYTALSTGTSTLSASAPGYAPVSVGVQAVGPAVPSTFFGMSINHPGTPDPQLAFGTTRSWDVDGVSWSEINVSYGSYAFQALDAFMARSEARHAEMIYTFGRTPQWASSQPNAPGPYGPGQCAPPADPATWDAYVRAVVTHAAGRIKHWEMWNEPNNPGFYCGDVATMIALSKRAAAIVKSIDPTASVLSPALTSNSGPAWLGWFLSGGGGAFVDVIAFHGYWSMDARDILQVVASYRAVMAANGVSGKPLWDTESSWAEDAGLPNPDPAKQVSFLSAYYLLHWSQGVSRLVWYAYDGGPNWGGLWTAAGGATAAATAYEQTRRWMAGASSTGPCSADGNGVWGCSYSRPGGYRAEAVWLPNSSATIAVPPGFVQYRDLAGVVHPITSSFVPVSDQPILLETAAPL